MNTDLTDNIYKDLKSFLTENSQYSPRVVTDAEKQTKKFPLVVLTEENNAFSTGTLKYHIRDIIDSIYWEINIYATNKILNNTTIPRKTICNELKSLIDDIMSKKYRLTRLSCRPTPNLDDTIYRITMRYTGDLFINKNRLI